MNRTVTIPTSQQIGATMRRIATTLAVGLAWAIVASEASYRAGLATGRAIHRLNDWLAAAIKSPMDTASATATAALAWADRVLAQPEPPTLVALLGGEILTDEQLQVEIKAYEKSLSPRKRPAARRKPAGARKAKAGA